MAATLRIRPRSDTLCLAVGAALLFCCSAPGAAAWQAKLYGTSPRPVLSNGVVHVGTADGQIVTLDAGTGAKRWSFQTGVGLLPGDVTNVGGSVDWKDPRAEIRLTPVLGGDTLFVASEDCWLYALNTGTGAVAWKRKLGGGLMDLTMRDSLLYVVEHAGPSEMLRAMARQDGQERWHFSATCMRLCSTPGRLYVSSWDPGDWNAPRTDSKKGFVHALDPFTGEELWKTQLPGMPPLTPVWADGIVYVAITSDIREPRRTTLFALDAGSGEIRWKFESSGIKFRFESMKMLSAATFGGVVILSTDEAVVALDPAAGRPIWKHDFVGKRRDPALGTDFGTGQDCVVGDSNTVFVTGRSVEAIDVRTGSVRWEVPCSGCNADYHLLDNGTLYLAGKKWRPLRDFASPLPGKIDAIEVATGKTRWTCGVKKEVHTLPTTANGKLFVPTWAGRNSQERLGELPPPAAIFAIDVATGKY